MADTKNQFEEAPFGFSVTIPEFSYPTKDQDAVFRSQIQSLWRFAAKRAAFDDLADEFANLNKQRVGAVALYIEGTSPEHEAEEAKQVLALLSRNLVLNRLKLLTYHPLKPGSYGAILFVESREPTTREKFSARVWKAITKTTQTLWTEGKKKAVTATIGIVFSTGAIFIGPNLKLPTEVKCNPDTVIVLRHDILNAQGAKDIDTAVKTHCEIVPPKVSDLVKTIIGKP
jgi:hypothetical protein